MEQLEKSSNDSRYYLLDSVRGICILGMIIYHTLFDAVAFFGVPVNAELVDIINVIRDFGSACFICLSGICIHFGKKPVKRILLILGFSLVVNIASFIAMPQMPIYFGILTFMGAASLIMLPLKKFFEKLPPVLFSVISFCLFIVTFEIMHGYLGYYDFVIFPLPEFLYKNMFTAFFGFPFYGFVSSDYYPLFPWFFMFLSGFFLWKILAKNEKILHFLKFRIKFLEPVGRYSLYIYIAHQPLILGILMLSNLIFNSR